MKPMIMVAMAILGGLACGRPDKTEPPLFDRTAAIAQRLPSVPPQATAYILDREKSRLVAVFSDGSTATTWDLEAPPTGWPQAPVDVWQVSPTLLQFVVPASEAAYYLSQINLDSGEHLQWDTAAKPATVVVLDDAIVVTPTQNFDVAGSSYTLPSDIFVLPPVLSLQGFPYISTGPALVWWDPVSAAALWHLPLEQPSSVLAFAAGRAAWVASGMVAAAAVSATGVTDIRHAPVEANVAALGFEAAQQDVLWLSLADGKLLRVVAGPDADKLCYVDIAEGGSALSNLNFIDLGILSNPVLTAIQLDLPSCPGWTQNDEWNVVFEGVPKVWTGISLAAATDVADIPDGHALIPGTEFRTASGERFTLTNASPLDWSPQAPGDVTGDLQPLGVWTYVSARRGVVQLAPSGQPVTAAGLVLAIIPGSDAPSRGDWFSFNTINGADGFSATTFFGSWAWFADGRLAALDRKANTVAVIDPVSNQIIQTLR